MAEISTLKQNSQFSDQNLQNIEGEKRLNTKLIDELQMDLNILNKKKEEIEVKLINSGMKQEESKGPVSESNHQEINRLISELKHINNIRSELIDKMNIYKMITERPY